MYCLKSLKIGQLLLPVLVRFELCLCNHTFLTSNSQTNDLPALILGLALI